MKCIPITLSGRVVTDAILVMDIEDVLDAKITLESVNLSKSAKIFNLRSIFSVAASTTKSTPVTPASIEV